MGRRRGWGRVSTSGRGARAWEVARLTTPAADSGGFSEALVLAAGSGVRLRPLTDTWPKPLIEIAEGTTILEIIARNARSIGVETLWVVTRNHADLYEQVCRGISARQELTMKVHLLPEPTRSSLQTLQQALPLVTTTPAVFLGDDVTLSPSLGALVDRFRFLQPAVLEAVVVDDDNASLRRTCSVAVDETGWITRIVEKPQAPTSRLRGCGIYLLGQEAVDFALSSSSASLTGITDLVAHFAQSHRAASSFFDGTNINVNTIDDLRLASQAYEALRATSRSTHGGDLRA